MGVLDLTGPWGTVLNTAVSLLDRVIPDPAQKAQAQLAIMQLQQSGELEQMKADVSLSLGQMDINKIEAASPDFFVHGWRPFVGWICGAGLSVQFLIAPIGVWAANLMGHPTVFPALDLGTLMTLLFGMLGLGAMHSYDKKAGTV